MKKLLGSLILSTVAVLSLTGALYAPDKAEIGTPKNYFTNGGFERGVAGASVYFDGGAVSYTGSSSTFTYTSGTAHHLSVGNQISFGAVSVPLSAGTIYYVQSVPSATTFTVANSAGTVQTPSSSGTSYFHAKYPIYGGGMAATTSGGTGVSQPMSISVVKSGAVTGSCTGTSGTSSLTCTYTTTAPAVGTVITGSSNIPTGSVVSSVSGSTVTISSNLTATISTATTLTFTGNPLKDTQSLVISYGQNQNESGFGTALPFTIDSSDQAQMMQVSFDYSLLGTGSSFTSGSLASGAITDSDLEVWIYDITNGVVIQPSGYNLTCGSVVGSACSANAIFQTASNSTSYRALIHNTQTSTPGAINATTVEIDNFVVSRVTKVYGFSGGDWVSYTPTFTGFGSPTVVNFASRRVGDTLEVHGSFVCGSSTAVANQITLGYNGANANVSADSTKLQLGTKVGDAGVATNSTTYFRSAVLQGTATNAVQISTQASGTNVNSQSANGSAICSSGQSVQVDFQVPISGWSSTVQQSDQADGRSVVLAINAVTPSGTPTGSGNINFGAATVDTHSGWNGSTTYTIPISGYYEMSLDSVISFTAGGSVSYSVAVATNTQTVCNGNDDDASLSANKLHGRCSGIVYATAGQTVSASFIQSGASGPTWQGASTSFSIKKISGLAAIGTSETVAMQYSDASSGAIGTSPAVYAFQSKNFDTHGDYSTSTGNYTCPISGKYRVSAQISTNGVALTTTQSVLIYLYHNGAQYAATRANGNGGGSSVGYSPSFSTTVQCLSGETLAVWASSSVATTALATGAYNTLAIERVGN